ncbi:MAG: hypothetical protein KatS3mg129_2307 [Leptospiraceae bacterium]|nr:MAG: hypothetical protein KatS3mg129_2307 [Leptospiraceae bacterium]
MVKLSSEEQVLLWFTLGYISWIYGDQYPPPANEYNERLLSSNQILRNDTKTMIKRSPYEVKNRIAYIYADYRVSIYSTGKVGKDKILEYNNHCITITIIFTESCIRGGEIIRYNDGKITEISYRLLRISPFYTRITIYFYGNTQSKDLIKDERIE